MKQSLLFISQFFPPADASSQTGGTISNRNFLRCLARDYEVTVLSFDSNADPIKFADEPYSVVHRPPPKWRATGLLLHWQAFVRQTVQEFIIATERPDFLIATTSTLAAFDVAPQQTKCLAVVRAFENFGVRCRWAPRKTRIDLIKGTILRRFQDVRLMRQADGVLTNSEFMRSAIAERFEIKPAYIHVLKQQVDFEPNEGAATKNTVGFVHRGPDKNIALVLELARRAPDLSFLVYGHSKGLPSTVSSNVSMMGWASDRSAMFSSAALWLVPSLWAEPFGRVSIEAQAADRPVLVADCGGLPETVSSDRYVIDNFLPDAWLSRMRQLLRMPEAEIAANGKIIRSSFSKEAHDQTIMETLAVISNHQRKLS